MPDLRSHLTYANVISTVALCVAVGGGTAYAATTLARNSVKSSHIAPGAVQSSDIKDGTIESRDLAASLEGGGGKDGASGKDGATGKDGARGGDGAVGPQGPMGPKGDVGPAGADLAFDGVRLGALTRHPEGTALVELGTAGPAIVTGSCLTSANTYPVSQVAVTIPGGSPTAIIVGGAAGSDVLAPGDSYSVEVVTSAQRAVAWQFTLAFVGGATYDVRGLIYRQAATNGALAPQGRACGLTEASVERISR